MKSFMLADMRAYPKVSGLSL